MNSLTGGKLATLPLVCVRHDAIGNWVFIHREPCAMLTRGNHP